MPKLRPIFRICVRFFAALLGLGLLGYLVFRTGPAVVWKQVQTVGWGLVLIIILGGFSQLIKTCAWRQTFTCDISGLSWSRSFGSQLVSDAVGQLGVAGKLLGEGLRVSLLGSVVPLASGISACAIDGGLHTLDGRSRCCIGNHCHFAARPPFWHVASLCIAARCCARSSGDPGGCGRRKSLAVDGKRGRAIGRLPQLHNWVSGKQPIIDSAEHNLLTFYHEAPAAFWASLTPQSPMARAGSLGGLCHPAVYGSKDRRGRRVCRGRPDKGDQPGGRV